MTFRWGERDGRAVKPGCGGWRLEIGWPPTVSYINPDTGNAACRWGFNVVKSIRWVAHSVQETELRHAYRHGERDGFKASEEFHRMMKGKRS